MAKFKLAKPKKAKAPQVQGGLPSFILLFTAIGLVGILMFL